MHPAWKPRGPEWARLAPGVRWYLRPVTGEVQAIVSARVAETVGNIFKGRADYEDLGFEMEDLGDLGDLVKLSGLSVYCGAVYTADQVLEAWEGIVDPETGVEIPCGTPEERTDEERIAIRAALRHGAPDGGSALLGPFMAWIERPRAPIAAEQRRLRELAKWEHSANGRMHCAGCDLDQAPCARGGTDAGALCPRVEHAPRSAEGIIAWRLCQRPGLWSRAGMDGAVVGLDYRAALAMADAEGVSDYGAFYRCCAAIEEGALVAMAEQRKEQA